MEIEEKDLNLRYLFFRRWVCVVVRSEDYNGKPCKEEDPHTGWFCGWRYEASVTEAFWKRFLAETKEEVDKLG